MTLRQPSKSFCSMSLLPSSSEAPIAFRPYACLGGTIKTSAKAWALLGPSILVQSTTTAVFAAHLTYVTAIAPYAEFRIADRTGGSVIASAYPWRWNSISAWVIEPEASARRTSSTSSANAGGAKKRQVVRRGCACAKRSRSPRFGN